MDNIIYPTNGGVSVIIPADDMLPLFYVAAKDVPMGAPFLLVDSSEIPLGDIDRAAWNADFSSPDGYGADFGAGSENAVIARNGHTLFIRNEQTGELSTATYPFSQ